MKKIRQFLDTTPEENEQVRQQAIAHRGKWGTPLSFIAREMRINQTYFNQWYLRRYAQSKEKLKRIQDFLNS